MTQVNKKMEVHIKEILANNKQEVGAVVDIHLDTFQGFFLTFMGRGFLNQLYLSYCEHESSSLLGAFDYENNMVGFLAYTTDLSGLYKYMLKKRLLPFAWYAMGAFWRKPKVFLRLIRAFLKPSESKRDDDYVELASIGVHRTAKSKGVGTQLVEELKQRIDFKKYAYITLETDTENNDAANYFYQKNGFVLKRTYLTHEGRAMNEYHFRR